MIHLDATPEIKAMAAKAFPEYNGRKFKLDNSGRPVNMTSHWDGGSRDTFVVMELSTGKLKPIPQNGTMFDRVSVGDTVVPPGFMIVEHTIFCGKDLGITFHVDPDTAMAMLPAPVALCDSERLVLRLTSNLKASYDGRKPRMDEARRQGIHASDFKAIQNALIGKGLLNKAGAITNAGRNAVGG